MELAAREALISSFARRGHCLDAAQVSLLLDYLGLLERWSRRFRLTGTRDPLEIAGRLLPQTLDFLRLWEPRSGDRVLDVGAGAGIVGVPIAVLFPEVEVVLVESAGWKAAFLGEVARLLPGVRLRVIAGRVEGLARGGAQEGGAGQTGLYCGILCRAVASLPKILGWVWPLLGVDGVLLVRQGRRGEKELEEASERMASLGAALRGVVPVEGGRIVALGRRRGGGRDVSRETAITT